MIPKKIDNLSCTLVVYLIEIYQKYISPRKGFCCAYRVVYGGESCSQYVKNSLIEYSFVQALNLAKKRFKACSHASSLKNKKSKKSKPIVSEKLKLFVAPENNCCTNCGDFFYDKENAELIECCAECCIEDGCEIISCLSDLGL